MTLTEIFMGWDFLDSMNSDIRNAAQFDSIRDSDGRLPSYAWPGGYPIYYVTHDGGFLCPDCANGRNGSLASPIAPDAEWRLRSNLDCPGCDLVPIHWEGDPIQCDHCGALIESAYGNPDSED